jgi:RNA polymerase sigma-70 factor (ECF subfamily)
MLNPSPVIALNHGVAVAMSGAVEDGLKRIGELGRSGGLARYYLFHAARADLLRRLSRNTEAAAAYRSALNLASNRVERNFLKRRLDEVEARVEA